MISYANRPLGLTVTDANDRVRETEVVQNLAVADLMVSYTPIPRLQLGLRLPVTFIQGQGVDPVTGEAAILQGLEPIEDFLVSDPELEVKWRFAGERDDPVVFGVAAFVTAPLGNAITSDSFAGADGLTAGARLIVDGRSDIFHYALNVGGRLQPGAQFGDETQIGSEAIFSAAAGVQLGPILRLGLEIFGTSRFSGQSGSNTLELLVGAQVKPNDSPLTLNVGAGPGLVRGAIGVPNVRAFAGLGYSYETVDTDSDGILDSEDLCPTDAEDRDQYEDSDGCPEPDNDGDALGDEFDKCPNRAEDIDQFEDSDGCPEDDNDKDGIPDLQDRCPNEPETENGFKDADGCPDVPDTDRDGVPDSRDQCRDEPEDTDGYEDTDGCPDPDNDGDGIPDNEDECVDEPEDINGEQDEDGCPDDV